MRLLLDTHALVWFLTGDAHLSRRARAAIEDPAADVFGSAVCGYEVAYKARTGRFPLPDAGRLPTLMRNEQIAEYPLTLAHMIAAGRLPGPHRDPWDRMIMAQALEDGMTVVTIDPVFRSYGVPVLW